MPEVPAVRLIPPGARRIGGPALSAGGALPHRGDVPVRAYFRPVRRLAGSARSAHSSCDHHQLGGGGGLFFAFNVALTQEMVLLAYKMTPWHALALALSSLALLHALVYTVGFAGQEDPERDGSFASVFARFTVVGYVLALAVSAWTFGRTDGTSATQVVMSTIVLGFPAALGAALARLIV